MDNEILTPTNIGDEKGNIEFSLFERAMALFMPVIGFCFSRFVISGGLGIATSVYYVLLIIMSVVFLRKTGVRPKVADYIRLAVVFVFTLSFGIFDNNFLNILNLFFVTGGTAYWVYSVCYGLNGVNRYFVHNILSAVFGVSFGAIGKCLNAIGVSIGKSKAAGKGKLVILGLIITFPLTLVVGTLLVSADNAFEQMINSIFDHDVTDLKIFILQAAIGLPVGFLIFGSLWSCSYRISDYEPDEERYRENAEIRRKAPSILVCSAVTPVCVLYVMYFISQSAYLLSAFGSSLPDGYSYADYARRGFFELCTVVVINLFVLIIMNSVAKRINGKEPVSVKIYMIMISVFTILLIASAFSKMIMYIDEYGLTRLRVYVSWLMILMALIFVMIIISRFSSKFNIARGTVTAFVIMFAFLNFSNVDRQIAKYNVNAYLSGEISHMDVIMFYDLSPSAAEYVIPLLDCADEAIRKRADKYLSCAYIRSECDDYRAFNIYGYRVHEILK